MHKRQLLILILFLQLFIFSFLAVYMTINSLPYHEFHDDLSLVNTQDIVHSIEFKKELEFRKKFDIFNFIKDGLPTDSIQLPRMENIEPDVKEETLVAINGTQISEIQNGILPEMSPNKNTKLLPEFEGNDFSKVDIEVSGHLIKFNKEIIKVKAPKKLKIHLVLHSHVDPGWLKTFEAYYQTKVKLILSNVLTKMEKRENFRFIWSEACFLARWMEEATEREKTLFRRFISTGQLEITAGSWVMTDEATPTFYSAIENIIEGHNTIFELFKAVPTTSWSVDPFGHGLMMSGLWKKAGIEHMIVGRLHDGLKEQLRQNQSLRWRWISPYSENLDGPVVNALPYRIYTTDGACLDRRICSCFFVGPSSKTQFSLNVPCAGDAYINKLTYKELEELTRKFVHQMRQVQEYYGTEDILVPVGHDFYFTDPEDLEQTFRGFSVVKDYLARDAKYFNAEVRGNSLKLSHQIRFSTVSEFFSSIKDQKLPTLKGDFFPYTDDPSGNYPWWTGYFVHRPYFKIRERRLQNCLRSLDLITILFNKTTENWKEIRKAKRELLLFQHHDGITGTSKPHVMEDYGKRMRSAFWIFRRLFVPTVLGSNGTLTHFPVFGKRKIFKLEEGEKSFLHVFSSHTRETTELLELATTFPIQVDTSSGNSRTIQSDQKEEIFLTEFLAPLAPLSVSTFIIKAQKSPDNPKTEVECFSFSPSGTIEAVLFGESFVTFEASLAVIGDNGGAYSLNFFGGKLKFLIPGGYRDEKGPLFFRRTFYNYSYDGLELTLTCSPNRPVDIKIRTDLNDSESLLLILKSNISSSSFWTDSNGLYHLERRHDSTLRLEANVYPIASSAFIQDQTRRMTIFSGQPTGGFSQKSGEMGLLVDRRVVSDDIKGLDQQDSYDNRTCTTHYKVLFEPSFSSPSHSPQGESILSSTLYPPIAFVSSIQPASYFEFPSWPKDIQLVTWRPLSDSVDLLVLRRLSSIQLLHLEDLFKSLAQKYRTIYDCSLSGVQNLSLTTVSSMELSLSKPYDIASFRLHK